MPIDSNSNSSQSHPSEANVEHDLQSDDFDGATENSLLPEGQTTQQALAAIASLQSPHNTADLQKALLGVKRPIDAVTVKPIISLLILVAIAITIIGLVLNNWIVGDLGILCALLLSLKVLLRLVANSHRQMVFIPRTLAVYCVFRGNRRPDWFNQILWYGRSPNILGR